MAINVDPLLWGRLTHGDETAFLDFLGFHLLQHQQFDVSIRRAGGKSYPTPPLDSAQDTWLLGDDSESSWYPGDSWHTSHQIIHDGEAAALLIAAPPDFQSYDLTNQDDFATWAWLHSLEHKRLRQAIGI